MRADDAGAVLRGAAPHDAVLLDAVLFDLDGVLTPTTDLHMRAWRAAFEAFFAAEGVGPPYGDADYFAHVDGRPRYDGVRAVLASRGVVLPDGRMLVTELPGNIKILPPPYTTPDPTPLLQLAGVSSPEPQLLVMVAHRQRLRAPDERPQEFRLA